MSEAPADALGGTLRVRAEGLAVGYGGRAVVEGVDLELPAGCVMTLIGPNGAGKSTILKTVTGQLAPLAGSLELSGRPLREMSERERALELSVVLTERPATELMTVSDVVEAGRYPHTGSLGVLHDDDRRAVREAMELVGVAELAGRDFMCLSDGQKQRVMLARAICQEPRTIVLDEPTSYLDVRHQLDLLSILRGLARERGLSILMALHELSLARVVSDRVVCVKDGRVFAQGAPEEMFRSELVDELYDLEPGLFDPATGSVRLPER